MNCYGENSMSHFSKVFKLTLITVAMTETHTLYHSRGLPDCLGNIIFGIIGEEEGQGYLGTHPLGKEFKKEKQQEKEKGKKEKGKSK